MKTTIQIAVQGTKALLTEMPRMAEGVREPLAVTVTFDPSWAEITPRRAVFWREGDALLTLTLDENGTAPIPYVFAASETPFYIRVTGREDGSLSTNELCASFFDLHSAEATEPRYEVFCGDYTITKNGTFFSDGTLLADAVKVALPLNADTTHDTVTAETLHKGVTAHDAKGDAITGTYVNSFNADTTRDTVTAETLRAGYTAHDASGNAITGTYTPPRILRSTIAFLTTRVIGGVPVPPRCTLTVKD